MSKRNPKNWCNVCGKHIKNASSGLCREHWMKSSLKEYGQAKQIKHSASTHSRHKHQLVRAHAHRVARWYLLDKACKVCGYDIYVELCHIKAIASFDEEAYLSEVNNPRNLAWLCPNHHKELELAIMA